MKIFQLAKQARLFQPSMKFSILVIFTVLVLLDYCVYCQGLNNISLLINDSVVIKKKRHDAVKLSISLTMDINTNDSILIKNFFRIVPANPFLFDTLPFTSKENCKYDALFYRIENCNGDYIPPRLILLQSNQNKFSDKHKNYRYLDTLKLRYKNSCNRKVIFANNDLIVRRDTSLFVYPDIDEFHYLQKGVYYLNLYYCNKDDRARTTLMFPHKPGKASEEEFRGYFQSNKIKVIVE